ncbi:MAG: N-acetylmuramoyl-L-alanine amidase [Bacteroidales bacterium]|jgi:N-acetylmuramoyl-L-alanine amidase|nr:N-acetylmuramoyl-L-alanine amidase [Bacteroidales bacterium]
MSPGIKNGKAGTINIYGIILILIFNVSLSIIASGSSPKTNGKWVIVIDPGHGGRDSGAPGLISKEKDINLSIALKAAKYIRENIKDVSVVLTRDDDSTVDLLERPKIANRNNADLFISIHANGVKSKSVMGAETYVMGLAVNEENLEVAMKENEVILLEDDYSTKYEGFDPKSPESYIIFTLTQNVYQKQSIDLASKIQTQLTESVGRKDRGVKQAGFWVLYRTSMPSVLIETGFITNPTEEKYLNSADGQDYLASAIFRACRDYLDELSLRSGIKVEPSSTPSASSTSKSVSSGQNNITFMVQIAAATTKTEIKPDNFKGLTDVEEINTGERYRYVSGSFDDYSDAARHRKKIEAIFPDAFVIALKDNKILPLQQALEQKRKK